MKIRPSLRKLEKAERRSQPGPFRSTYEAHKAAELRVINRLTAALDRINVASQFDEFSGSVVAQLGHAERYIREGREEAETIDGWPVYVDDEPAHEMVRMLASMLHDAYVAELMDRRAARKAGKE